MKLRGGRRGQSTVEAAIIAPFIIGMILLTLQVGLLTSDQVNLQQTAYDAGLWAVANRSTADATAIQRHIYRALCGTDGFSPASGAPTRYCRTSAGAGQAGYLSVTVNAQNNANAMAPLPSPTGAVLSAATCNGFDLTSVTTDNASITAGTGVATITTTIRDAGGGTVSHVTLSASGYPDTLGRPTFNPPNAYPASAGGTTTATFQVQTPAAVQTGTYTITISGVDQCGNGPSGGSKTIDITVTPGAAQPSPTTLLSVPPFIGTLVPTCLAPSATLTINGLHFTAGATVTIGGLAATNVTWISATQLTATVPAAADGLHNVTITNPDGGTAQVVDALSTKSAGCPSPSGGGAATTGVCAAGDTTHNIRLVIRITWNEPLVVPWLASAAPYYSLTATQDAWCASV